MGMPFKGGWKNMNAPSLKNEKKRQKNTKILVTKNINKKRDRKQKAPFCPNCGKPKILRSTGYFDKETGQLIYRYECMNFGCDSNKICPFGIHDFGFLGLNFKCSKCGKYDTPIF